MRSLFAQRARGAAALAACLLALGACTPAGVVVGAGAVTGLSAAEERGIAGNTADLKTEAEIQEKFFNTDIRLHGAVGVEVYDGRVLLTGATEDVDLADKAVRLAWQVDDVKDVINEIQISKTGITDFVRDSWITGQLRSKMTFDKEILAINYSIETVNGIVYLIGIAQDQKELDRVIAHANNIKFVRSVVTHVRLKKI